MTQITSLGHAIAITYLITQWGGGQAQAPKLIQAELAGFVIYTVSGKRHPSFLCLRASERRPGNLSNTTAMIVTLTKVSILLFYRRVLGVNISWYLIFGLIIGHGIASTIVSLAGCQPFDYLWMQFAADQEAVGSCVDLSLFYYWSGIIGLIIDISILLSPIPMSQ